MLGKLDCIGQQVIQHLAQSDWIAPYKQRTIGHLIYQLDIPLTFQKLLRDCNPLLHKLS